MQSFFLRRDGAPADTSRSQGSRGRIIKIRWKSERQDGPGEPPLRGSQRSRSAAIRTCSSISCDLSEDHTECVAQRANGRSAEAAAGTDSGGTQSPLSGPSRSFRQARPNRLTHPSWMLFRLWRRRLGVCPFGSNPQQPPWVVRIFGGTRDAAIRPCSSISCDTLSRLPAST